MHRARRTILVIVAGAPTPVVTIREARIDNLQSDGRPAPRAIVVGIKAACGELIASSASTAAIRLASAVEGALEKLLVDGTIIHARATRPLPRILAAVASAALKAVVLAKMSAMIYPAVMIDQDLRK